MSGASGAVGVSSTSSTSPIARDVADAATVGAPGVRNDSVAPAARGVGRRTRTRAVTGAGCSPAGERSVAFGDAHEQAPARPSVTKSAATVSAPATGLTGLTRLRILLRAA